VELSESNNGNGECKEQNSFHLKVS